VDTHSSTYSASPATLALPGDFVRVPVVTQAKDFTCGNAATLALLRYWRWDEFAAVDESALYGALETTQAGGTEPGPMAAFLRACGLEASYRRDDVTLEELLRAVDAREPPIVDLQAWRDDATPWRETWNAGHYVVLVGYDDALLYVMDPSVLALGGYAYLPRAELDERWHDLAGPADEHVERMAIFARGPAPCTPRGPASASARAIRLR
jgi:predicted double-glycine peptidase